LAKECFTRRLEHWTPSLAGKGVKSLKGAAGNIAKIREKQG